MRPVVRRVASRMRSRRIPPIVTSRVESEPCRLRNSLKPPEKNGSTG